MLVIFNEIKIKGELILGRKELIVTNSIAFLRMMKEKSSTKIPDIKAETNQIKIEEGAKEKVDQSLRFKWLKTPEIRTLGKKSVT